MRKLVLISLFILFSLSVEAFRSSIGFWRSQCPIYSYGPDYFVNGGVSAFAHDGFATYIGGQFTTVQGVSRSGVAALDPSGNLLPFNPRVGGPVEDMEIINNKLYVGGNFKHVNGVVTQTSGAEIDNSNALNQNFPQIMGTIKAVIPDGAGGWIVAGLFSTIGAYTRSNLARINSDGSVHAFAPLVNNEIVSLALSGTTLYLGGSFSLIGATTRNNIAAVDIDTGAVVAAFNPNSNGRVNAMVLSGSTLYVGGTFTTIGGLSRTRLAALNTSNGTATTTFTLTANNAVNTMSMNGTTLYVGGIFTQISGSGRANLAALNTGVSPATLAAWSPNLNSSVQKVYHNGTTLYVGGNFTTAGGTGRNRIVAYDTTTPAAPTISTLDPNMSAAVYDLVVRGSYLYAIGTFSTSGGASRYMFSEISLADSSTTSFDMNIYAIGGTGYALGVQGTRIFFAGNFTSVGTGVARNYAAAFDLTSNTNNVTAFNPDFDGAVSDLESNGTTLYISGNFANAGGSPRGGIAAFTHATDTMTAFNPVVGAGTAISLKLDGTTLYAGGFFSSLGGAARTNFGALDTTLDTNNALPFNPAPDGFVFDLAFKGPNIYAVGLFSNIGGAARSKIAALNKTSGVVTAFDPGTDAGILFKVGIKDNSLYTIGSFTTLGGQARNQLGAVNLNLDTNNATSFNPTRVGVANDMAVIGDTLYVSGSGTTFGSAARSGLAAMKVCDP